MVGLLRRRGRHRGGGIDLVEDRTIVLFGPGHGDDHLELAQITLQHGCGAGEFHQQCRIVVVVGRHRLHGFGFFVLRVDQLVHQLVRAHEARLFKPMKELARFAVDEAEIDQFCERLREIDVTENRIIGLAQLVELAVDHSRGLSEALRGAFEHRVFEIDLGARIDDLLCSTHGNGRELG